MYVYYFKIDLENLMEKMPVPSFRRIQAAGSINVQYDIKSVSGKWPPGHVSGLTVTRQGNSKAKLQWTASGAHFTKGTGKSMNND